jgi:hypothetical protein
LAARAGVISLQLNSSADNGQGYGYATTTGNNFRIGGNYGPIGDTHISNVYLSNDHGLTFLNSGDGPTTAINLPTSTVGTFTYQFYYTNAWAHALTLQLWSSSPESFGPTIVVSTQHDSAPGSFVPTFEPSTVPPFVFPALAELPPGSAQTTVEDYTVTLTEFAFTNGSGPAHPFFVTPGDSFTPEIYGEFTYQVTPEPSSFFLVAIGGSALLAYAWRRRKTAATVGTILSKPQVRA